MDQGRGSGGQCPRQRLRLQQAGARTLLAKAAAEAGGDMLTGDKQRSSPAAGPTGQVPRASSSHRVAAQS